MMVQPHKAIVGANAFAHESGIHQDGMLKNRETYEIMSPETIGLVRKDEAGIVLGKHSGRHALSTALHGLGYDIRDEQMDGVFRRFKELADRKKSGITDEDLEALMGDQVFQPETVWELQDLQVVCGTMGLPTATVRLRGPDGLSRVSTAIGTGPVDAAYQAIDQLVQVPCQLTDYNVQSVTQGIDALANTRVSIVPKGARGISTSAQGRTFKRSFTGMGADEDIVVSSARSYISAMNKMIAFLKSEEQKATAARRDQDRDQAAQKESEMPVTN